jgi:[ribosomal protein S5]-alanine N-acetyltransferase
MEPGVFNRIRTVRMDLILATVEVFETDLHDRTRLGITLDAVVPPDWPPEQVTPEVLEEFIRRMRVDEQRLFGFYWVLRDGGDGSRVLIGNGGFLVHDDGSLEVGYSVLPGYQGSGYAPEAVGGMVAWAVSRGLADRIISCTYPRLAASVRVLEKNGFSFAGSGPEEGTVAYVWQKQER